MVPDLGFRVHGTSLYFFLHEHPEPAVVHVNPKLRFEFLSDGGSFCVY